MKHLIVILALLSFVYSEAQESNIFNNDNAIPNVVDSLYREDQFYVGLSFSLLTNQPPSFSQNGFSGGLNLGFIRDMPINDRRNVAIGVGLGFSTNTYNTNLFIGELEDEQTIFQIVDENADGFESNRFNTNLVEIPIQLRWRTSTPTVVSFWRIYSGIKVGHIFHFKSTYKQDGITLRQTDVPELNRMLYTATLTIGNGSFNAFVHYSLNNLFNDQAITTDGDRVDLQPIKFGIEFYLL